MSIWERINMEINETPISDLFIVNTEYHHDNRGSFARFFCEEELSRLIGDRQIVQINHSINKSKGSIRGLHFQHPPAQEMKIIRCLKGRVFDVSVDLRAGSKTFLKWHAEILSAENAKAMVISEGFAHGFQTLDMNSELLYLHTAHYQPEFEDGLKFDDPLIKISWPLPSSQISDKDNAYAFLKDDFVGLSL